MKLAFIIGSLHIGGAERVMTELCDGLVQRGHEVVLIYNFRNKDYEVNQKVKQIDLASFELDVYHGNAFSRLGNRIRNVYRDYKFLKSFIKDEKPDCFTSFMQCWAWFLIVGFRGKTHIVFSEHSSMLRPSNSFTGWIKKNILLPKADAVTVLTHFDQGLVYKKMSNTVCMPNPLTFAPISKEEYDEIFPKRTNVLACGRFDRVKGYDNLIHAFAKIADRFPGWYLDIAGKDMPGRHYSDSLKQLTKDLGIESRVRFIGFHSDVQSLMKQYAVFCVPSRSEGFSLTLIEAMASGMATVSFELSGPREITLNNVDGLLVDNQNNEALANGIKTLIEDKQLRYRLGLQSITNVKRFSEKCIIDKWEALYTKLSCK